MRAAILGLTLLSITFAAGPSDAEHALSRLTWGERPGDVERVRQAGVKKWIADQLHPERIQESPELQSRLSSLEPLSRSAADLMEAFRNRKDDRRTLREIPKAAVEAKILRALYSERQLEDVLTDFWFNHFNVFIGKGADRVLIAAYERDAIRPHVLGKFRDLLGATAEHPAMLFYLDNWRSVGPGAPAARRGKRTLGLNENYARELMELHTLGVDGGYTQKDVQEVARAFTGWTIKREGGAFVPAMHDDGEKIVLGRRIAPGGGRNDAVQVLDLLARHPSTARFVSSKLAQRFVADNPPESLVKAMAATFSRTDGDLRAVMTTMLDSKEFWAAGARRSKLKSPLEFVISAVRAGGAELRNVNALAGEIARMGQPLYGKQEPTGYGNNSDEWKNSASLLARMNFATSLASNRVPGVRASWEGDGKAAALRLGSPEFQRR